MMFSTNAATPMPPGVSPDILWGVMTGQLAIVEVVEEEWDDGDELEWDHTPSPLQGLIQDCQGWIDRLQDVFMDHGRDEFEYDFQHDWDDE